MNIYTYTQILMIILKVFNVGTAGSSSWFIILIPTWILFLVLVVGLFVTLIKDFNKK